MSKDMLDAAVALTECGFKVLPIKSGSKIPACQHGVNDATKDPAQLSTWFERTSNTTGVSGEGFIIFDFDCHGEVDGRETLLEWENEHGALPATLAQTTPSGGYHLIFRSPDEIRPSVNSSLAVDVRAWGSYIVCAPTPGYTWEEDATPENIADANEQVLAFLEYVRPAKERHERVQAPEGGTAQGGRNDTLFKLACSLQSQNMPDTAIRAAIQAYNTVECMPPLEAHEVNKVLNSALSKPKGHSEEVKAKRGRPKKFEHNVVGRRLIEERGACLIDGETPALRSERGNYLLGWDAFDNVMVNLYDGCTEANRREVKAWIKAKAKTRRQSRATLIAFNNGILDVDTMEFRTEYTDEDVICNVIPHNWNLSARSDVLDKTLEKMACGDIPTLLNLTEFLGMCMMRGVKQLPFFPVLIGEGSNGKSTYIGLIKDVVGMENISGLQPKDITAKFLGGHIVGKTANLGDDIASGYLDDKDCAIIKSVATGDLMFTDVKGTKGFHFEPYCTMVFSCNAFPRLADTTPGFMRRLFPIEFNAVFAPTDEDFDPLIGEKLREESTLEYACVVGIEGLRRALAQNRPTPNELSEALKSTIMTEANTCLQWIFDKNIKLENVLDKSKAELYEQYAGWCEQNGYGRTLMGSGTFVLQMSTYFRVKLSKVVNRGVGIHRHSVRVFEKKEVKHG